MAEQPTSGGADDDAGHRLRQEAAELRAEVARLRHALAAAQAGPADPAAQQVHAAAQHAQEHGASHAGPPAAAVRSHGLRITHLAPGSSRAALFQNEEHLRAIIESAVDHAIITADFQNRITGWNSGAARLLGWNEADVLGRPLRLIFTPEDCAAGVPEAEARKALAEGAAGLRHPGRSRGGGGRPRARCVACARAAGRARGGRGGAGHEP